MLSLGLLLVGLAMTTETARAACPPFGNASLKDVLEPLVWDEIMELAADGGSKCSLRQLTDIQEMLTRLIKEVELSIEGIYYPDTNPHSNWVINQRIFEGCKGDQSCRLKKFKHGLGELLYAADEVLARRIIQLEIRK